MTGSISGSVNIGAGGEEKPGFVGVFDSGLGGISVLSELVSALPTTDFEYVGDSANAPYGTKNSDFVLGRSLEICGDFVSRGAAAIVIACNTATSISVKTLRERYSIPVVGMEPAVKPALGYVRERRDQEGRTLRAAVLATPMTLAEEKYKALVSALGAGESVIEVPSPELVELVEHHLFDEDRVRRFVDAYVRSKLDCIDRLGAVVLGCTHFVFLRRYFEERLGGIEIFDGNRGTAMRLRSLIEGEAASENILFRGRIKVRNTAGDEKAEFSRKLLRHELSRGDYDRAEAALGEIVESRLGGLEQKFARLYYFERAGLSDIAEKLGIGEKKLAALKESVAAVLFKYLRNM